MAEKCPECGASLVPTATKGVLMCIDCQWSGDADEAIPDTSSPLDVRATQGEVVFEVEVAVSQRGRTEPKNIRLSPDGARRFAEALEQGADDAERRDDRDGGGGGKPRPPGGMQP